MELILPLAESGGKVPSDIYCLCGRIYKDMFISSSFSDNHSRDQACYWCGRCSCGDGIFVRLLYYVAHVVL